MAACHLWKEICTYLFFACIISQGNCVCTGPSPITFLASNSTAGTRLTYKDSFSNSSGTVDFEGHFLSSALACGLDFHRCPNLTVITEGSIVLVVIPLSKFIGVTTFENEGVLTFREKHIVNLTFLDLDCEVSSISEYPVPGGDSSRRRVSFMVNCLYQDGNSVELELEVIQIILNITDLAMKEEIILLTSHPCIVQSLSNSVFFISEDFTAGVSVFVSGTTVFYQRIFTQYCIELGSFGSCVAVQQLMHIPPNYLALYCQNRTFLFELISRDSKEFTRTEDGLPIFCSTSTYYRYLHGNLSLHQNDNNRTQIGPAVSLQDPNEDVVWGRCIGERYVVLYSSTKSVIIYDANSSNFLQIAKSIVIPRIFQESFVLLMNESQALVYDIQSRNLVESVPQDFDLGYVLGGPIVGRDCNNGPTTVVDQTSGSTGIIDSTGSPNTIQTPQPGLSYTVETVVPTQPGRSYTVAIAIPLVIVVTVAAAAAAASIVITIICVKGCKCRKETNICHVTNALQDHQLHSEDNSTELTKSTPLKSILETSFTELNSNNVSISTPLDGSEAKFGDPLSQEHIDKSQKPSSAEEYYQKNNFPFLEPARNPNKVVVCEPESNSNDAGPSGIIRQESYTPAPHLPVASPNVVQQESCDHVGTAACAVYPQSGTPNFSKPRQARASVEDQEALASVEDDDSHRGAEEQMINNNRDFEINATAQEEVNGAARDRVRDGHQNHKNPLEKL